METLPTQDVVDGFFDEHEEADENPEIVWGRLLPVGKTFVAVGRSFFVVPKFDFVKKCNALSKVPVWFANQSINKANICFLSHV